ncbi:MAG TPA: hypothetical protein DEA80_06945, partial [Afipia sp.]|nr:hypothetical protein [Afipia sp.]
MGIAAKTYVEARTLIGLREAPLHQQSQASDHAAGSAPKQNGEPKAPRLHQIRNDQFSFSMA